MTLTVYVLDVDGATCPNTTNCLTRKEDQMNKVFIVLLFTILFSHVYAQIAIHPSGGDGTSSSPYTISNLENLFWLSQSSGEWDKSYIQTADIDASPTHTWFPNGSGGYLGFITIGNTSIQFTGSYNGAGFYIRNLYINRPSSNDIGFFGKLRNAGTANDFVMVSNLGLVNVEITGGHYVGGLAGSINGWYLGEAFYQPAINNSYVTCSVSGSNYLGGFIGISDCAIVCASSFSGVVNGGWEAGGFVGSVTNYSQVHNCYSSGTITYGYNTGGFAGQMTSYGSLNNCYSSCQIASGINIGGLVGVASDATSTATNSFWDIESSGTASSALGTGRTTAQLKTRSTYPETWDFSSPTAPWWIVDGQMRPILHSEYSRRISTPHQLQLMKLDPTVDYVLVCNLDMVGTQVHSAIWGTQPDANGGFVPIGSDASMFSGNLEGNNFTISNLYIKRPTNGQQSLLGKCNTSEVNNLAITNAYVKGETYTGGLSSETTLSSFTNCSYSGVVQSTWSFTGGLCAYMNQSSVSYCNTNGSIYSSNSWAGGISGYSNNASAVSNSYSRSSVEGSGRIAGLIGGSYNSNVTNCYSSGLVRGYNAVGGLIGEITAGTVSACFWDVLTSLQVYSAGGAGVQGKTTTEMTAQSTFTNAGWDFATIWAMNPENNDGYPYLIWGQPPEPPSIPENVHIAYQDGLIVITWDEAANADSYLVESSDNPIVGFLEEPGGSFAGNSWSKAEDYVHRLYRVISVAE